MYTINAFLPSGTVLTTFYVVDVNHLFRVAAFLDENEVYFNVTKDRDMKKPSHFGWGDFTYWSY